MTELPRHSVSVTGVVFRDDGRVLAIQQCDDGRWVPPGGVLELAETPSEGVAREVLEETGIKVQAEAAHGRLQEYVPGRRDPRLPGQRHRRPSHPTGEARKVAWLTVDEATRDMPEARGVRVIDALSDEAPFVRVHDGTRLLDS